MLMGEDPDYIKHGQGQHHPDDNAYPDEAQGHPEFGDQAPKFSQ
jgi:hypothetical protein